VSAQWRDGWLQVPYSGEELAAIEITAGGVHYPAYRDWDENGTRIVQIRIPREQVPGEVHVRVNGAHHSTHPVPGFRSGRPGGPHASHGVA
jgi:hypothetical protein